MTIKVLSVFGTRPEAIKMCPLVKALEKRENIESIVCVTAQHREMLDEVLDIFQVKPDYDLDIMKHNQSLIQISNKVLVGVDEIIRECEPHIVLVHGDTSTTLNSALAGFYNKIPVGHVEAGLRTKDIYSPFPEEINRRLTSNLATLHFAPTQGNRDNLLKEGISKGVFVTGNTGIDALYSAIREEYSFEQKELESVDFTKNKVILLTAHRRENWGKPMEQIFQGVKELLEHHEEIEVVFPMHKNPNIRKQAKEIFENVQGKIHLIEPLEYEGMVNLMDKCYLIMTDSGGLQEEGPALGKPVVVLRTETERPEALEAGTVVLAGVETKNIVDITSKLLKDKGAYETMARAVNPYGDGKSCERIVSLIEEYLNK